MVHSHKTTQYWLVVLKVLLLVLALGYIIIKLNGEDTSVVAYFETILQKGNLSWLLGFVGLAILNWLLEIQKWKITVGSWFSINYTKAIRQCLGSLTASLFTPNRIGEYGAKAFYFPPKKRKRILFLNFVHSSSQMLVTLTLGVPAMFYFIWTQQIAIATSNIIVLAVSVMVVGTLGYLYRKKQLSFIGFSLQSLWQKFKQISATTKISMVLLSIARYGVFSFLFFQLLQFYGSSLGILDTMTCIFSMYLLVSLVPSFFIMDVVIRGGVAVWLFSFFGVAEIVVLTTVFTMWMLNTVLPAFIGSYFVLTFKWPPS